MVGQQRNPFGQAHGNASKKRTSGGISNWYHCTCLVIYMQRLSIFGLRNHSGSISVIGLECIGQSGQVFRVKRDALNCPFQYSFHIFGTLDQFSEIRSCGFFPFSATVQMRFVRWIHKDSLWDILSKLAIPGRQSFEFTWTLKMRASPAWGSTFTFLLQASALVAAA